jgi:hypothetical protein
MLLSWLMFRSMDGEKRSGVVECVGLFAAAADGTWPRSCMRPTDEAYVSRELAVWESTEPAISDVPPSMALRTGVVFR